MLISGMLCLPIFIYALYLINLCDGVSRKTMKQAKGDANSKILYWQ